MGPFDTGLFHAINNGPQSLAPTMQFFSNALNIVWVKVVFGIFLLALLAANSRTRRAAIHALVAVGIANGFTDLFKTFLPEHRPFQELKSYNLLVGWSDSYGTASAHSANMAAVAFVFVYQLGWWGTPWVAIAIITGYSRVFCAAHYPHQVLLGWICGIVAALAVTKGWELIVAARTRKLEDVVTD